MKLRSLKRLKTLMTINEVSARQLAIVAGWESHTYMLRILRGDADTMKVEPAVRIAHFFGVGLEDLFITKVSSDTSRNDRSNAA